MQKLQLLAFDITIKNREKKISIYYLFLLSAGVSNTNFMTAVKKYCFKMIPMQ